MKEIYVSTDIEADGPIPGDYSMLSFGSAAFNAQKELISTFSANLKTIPRAKQDPATMQWWSKHKKAWNAHRKDLKDPKVAMKEYARWLKTLGAIPVFVGYPASFDFTFIYWYLMKFTGVCPFSFAALDIKTYAMSILRKPFHRTTKSTMPKRWFDMSKKRHIALDDAMEQGYLFCNMLAENTK